MDGKLVFVLAVCLAYASADNHDGGENCREELSHCDDKYMYMSHNDYDVLWEYYNCVANVDCSDDYDGEVNTKQPQLRRLEEQMNMMNQWTESASPTLAASMTTIGVALFLALKF